MFRQLLESRIQSSKLPFCHHANVALLRLEQSDLRTFAAAGRQKRTSAHGEAYPHHTYDSGRQPRPSPASQPEERAQCCGGDPDRIPDPVRDDPR